MTPRFQLGKILTQQIPNIRSRKDPYPYVQARNKSKVNWYRNELSQYENQRTLVQRRDVLERKRDILGRKREVLEQK